MTRSTWKVQRSASVPVGSDDWISTFMALAQHSEHQHSSRLQQASSPVAFGAAEETETVTWVPRGQRGYPALHSPPKYCTTKTVLTRQDPVSWNGMVAMECPAWQSSSAFSPPILTTMGPGTGGVSPVSTGNAGTHMNVREWGAGRVALELIHTTLIHIQSSLEFHHSRTRSGRSTRNPPRTNNAATYPQATLAGPCIALMTAIVDTQSFCQSRGRGTRHTELCMYSKVPC